MGSMVSVLAKAKSMVSAGTFAATAFNATINLVVLMGLYQLYLIFDYLFDLLKKKLRDY